ncbi:MAG: RNA ligase family protein [Nanoarchaeota archaeon]
MSEKLAVVKRVISVKQHPNADFLDLVQVGNYNCIVKKNDFKVGDLVVFISPDSVLPDTEWAKFYKSKSNRVKAIKLRGQWSFGIVESFENLGLDKNNFQENDDLTEILGIIHYEPPIPQELNAKGNLPFGIPKTDEERYQNLELVPFGEVVDVTRKMDGSNISFYCKLNSENNPDKGFCETGVCGRTLEYKLDSVNNYTQIEKKYNVLSKLREFCLKNSVSLCLRGEMTGQGIQKFSVNPDCAGELKVNFFSVWLIDEHKYANKGHKYYIHNISKELDLPTVSMLEKNVELTNDLILKYDEQLEQIDGKFFEGIVIQGRDFSFKVISKIYDSLK